MSEMVHNINEGLLPLAWPINQLRTLPGNPKKGNVPSVMNSYEEFGQQKPIVARLDSDGKGVVLAGNTQFRAATNLGWTHIAVTWVDEWDDKKATAFALADNRTADLGEYDEDALQAMIDSLEDAPELLLASGYDDDFQIDVSDDPIPDLPTGSVDFDDEDEDEYEDDEDDEPAPARQAPQPTIRAEIVFSNVEQQQRWYAFNRWLRKQNPDAETAADRLNAFLLDLDFENADD